MEVAGLAFEFATVLGTVAVVALLLRRHGTLERKLDFEARHPGLAAADLAVAFEQLAAARPWRVGLVLFLGTVGALKLLFDLLALAELPVDRVGAIVAYGSPLALAALMLAQLRRHARGRAAASDSAA